MKYPRRDGLHGWRRVLVGIVQLALFVWFMPDAFHHFVSEAYSFDTRLVLAALVAGSSAWLFGALLGLWMEYLQRYK